MSRCFRRLLFCLLFLPLAVFAQASSVEGVVLDPNRQALPRATVRLADASGKQIGRALTDSHGRFRFETAGAGPFTLSAELVGFAPVRRRVAAGESVELTLAVAPVRERVVVTPTRTVTTTAQVGAGVTVLSADELEGRAVLSTADALRAVVGAAVARSGGLGAATSLFLRGGESDHNKILLDGIPLNDPGGFYDFSILSAENLDRIEVVRGPQSALFGSDAMGGVVQLFTRRGRSETRRPRFSLAAEGGNNDTWRTRAGLAGELGRFDYSFGWARLSTDNREPNSAFHISSLSSNLGFELHRSTTLRLVLRGELGRAGTPGQTAFGRPDSDAFLRRRDADLAMRLDNQTTNSWEQRLTYSRAQTRQVSRNLFEDPPFVPTFGDRMAPFPFFDFPFDFLNENRRHQVSYQSDWRTGNAGNRAGQHWVTLAFEWDRERGAIGDRLFGGVPVHARRDNLGWVVQHQALWGRLFLTNGVRVEDNDSFGTAVVPRSSLAYFLRYGHDTFGATKLKFNFGLGIKEPSLLESFSPGPFVAGNPTLAPERVRSFDVGVEQRFWRDRGKLELVGFDNRFRDLIGFEITSFVPFTGTFFNIGRTKAKGVEATLELAPGWGLRGRGSYTLVDSQVTHSGTVFDPVFEIGNRLLRRPKHSSTLELFWERRRLQVVSTTLFVGRRTDSDFSLLGLTSNRGYTKWDLAAAYRAAHRVTYFGAVENLLNRDYMEVLGFRALKVTFRAGARVEF